MLRLDLKFMARLSPSKAMAQTSKKVISADKRDIMLSTPPPPSIWQSDSNISSGESFSSSNDNGINEGDDSLPNDNIAIVVRITHWLAERTHTSPKDVFHDVTKLFLREASSVEAHGQWAGQNSLPYFPPNNSATTPTPSSLDLNHAYEPAMRAREVLLSQQNNVSRFSFVPGDDSRPTPASPSLSAVSKVSQATVQVTFAHGTNTVPQASQKALVPPRRDGSGTSTSTTNKENIQPKRDSSGRSAVTVIKDSSSRTLSLSKKDSNSKSGNTANPEDPAQRLRDNALAMAAARAAEERQKLDRSVSSG